MLMHVSFHYKMHGMNFGFQVEDAEYVSFNIFLGGEKTSEWEPVDGICTSGAWQPVQVEQASA